MSITLPAITIWQPWASLIAIGAKQFETRDYPPPAKHLGKRIAIHAAKRSLDLLSLERGLFRQILDLDASGRLPKPCPLGAVVCTAVLSAAYQCGEMDAAGNVQVVRAISRGDDPVLIQADPFGDYSPGRWAWLLTDVEQLATPAPARGKQGWWTWSPSIHSNSALPLQRRSSAPGGSPALFQE